MAQAAQVIPMKRATTWDDVRNEWNKTEQMGFQSVMQAAKVGQMLIELKESTPHGEFEAKVASVLLMNKFASSRLMTLARHVELLEQTKPDSQRKALEIIKGAKPKKERAPREQPQPKDEQPPKEEPFRMGWSKVILNALGVVIHTTHRRRIEQQMGEKIPGYFTDKETAEAFVQRYIKIVGLPDDAKRDPLPATAEAKLKRAIDIETAKLQGQFKKAVRQEFEATQAERLQQLDAKEQQVIDEIKKYKSMRDGIGAHMKKEDYKFLLGLLHPDRAPKGFEEKFHRAFDIIRKLDGYIASAE